MGSAQHARSKMQAHDQFFKLTFAKANNAADLLRSVLPAALVKYLDLDNLTDARATSVRTSSVDGKVEQRFNDLLFRIRFIDRDLVLYSLLEHKSRPENFTTFQSTRYAIDALSAHLKNHINAAHLPDILSVVVHHGAGGWTKSTDLVHDFPTLPNDALDAIIKYRIRSQFILYDVATESYEQLRQRGMNAEATLALWAMVHAPGNKDLTTALPLVHDLMEAVRDQHHGHEDLAAIVSYILQVSETPLDKIYPYLTANLGPKAEKAYMTAAEQLRQQERQRQEQLRQQERQLQQQERDEIRQRLRDNLCAALQDRGLTIPDVLRTRIDRCDNIEQLTIWLRRAATADSASAVLQEPS